MNHAISHRYKHALDEPISVEAYLRFERTSDIKHEYVDGWLHAMAGASKRHDTIVLNLIAALLPVTRGKACALYSSDVKVRVSGTRFYYPDLSIVCQPDGEDEYFVTRPCLVVEVLSPSTSATDRREKVLAYRGIESLQGYLIVHQHLARVERHWRDENRAWWHEVIDGVGSFRVPCIDLELSLTDVFAGLEPTTPRELAELAAVYEAYPDPATAAQFHIETRTP